MEKLFGLLGGLSGGLAIALVVGVFIDMPINGFLVVYALASSVMAVLALEVRAIYKNALPAFGESANIGLAVSGVFALLLTMAVFTLNWPVPYVMSLAFALFFSGAAAGIAYRGVIAGWRFLTGDAFPTF